MKGKTILWSGVAVAALLASSASLVPAYAANTNAELEERVRVLEERLSSYLDKADEQHTRLSTLEQNFNETTISIANGRPTISSGDGRFSAALRLRFQADYAQFMQESSFAPGVPAGARDLGSGAIFRRAYFGLEGKAFKDFWYEFRINGGGSGAEAFELNLARVAYTGIPNFRINVGVIQPIFTEADTVSSGQTMFIERPEIANAATDVFGGGDGRRGIELTYQKQDVFGYGDNLILSGAFTGGKTGSVHAVAPNGDESSQILGRAAYRFWSDGVSNAQIGGSYGFVLNSGGTGAVVPTLTLQDRPGTRVDGSRLVSAGVQAQTASMWGIDAEMNWENFYIGGEYHKYYLDRFASAIDPEFDGWYVEASWIMTGETKPYSAASNGNEMGSWGAPKVITPFSFSGETWGTWELVARYSTINLDYMAGPLGVAPVAGAVTGGTEVSMEFGINWYLNNNVRFMLHDNIVNVNRKQGAAAPAPVWGQAGQNLNILMARIQFTN